MGFRGHERIMAQVCGYLMCLEIMALIGLKCHIQPFASAWWGQIAPETKKSAELRCMFLDSSRDGGMVLMSDARFQVTSKRAGYQ